MTDKRGAPKAFILKSLFTWVNRCLGLLVAWTFFKIKHLTHLLVKLSNKFVYLNQTLTFKWKLSVKDWFILASLLKADLNSVDEKFKILNHKKCIIRISVLSVLNHVFVFLFNIDHTQISFIWLCIYHIHLKVNVFSPVVTHECTTVKLCQSECVGVCASLFVHRNMRVWECVAVCYCLLSEPTQLMSIWSVVRGGAQAWGCCRQRRRQS